SRTTHNATFLQALADGPLRSVSLAGKTSGRRGQDHVPVSRFRAREVGKAMPTNATSGPLFFTSLRSSNLQSFLESRLRARTASNGSPEYVLTWKTLDMPAGPQICALRASAPRTFVRDYS